MILEGQLGRRKGQICSWLGRKIQPKLNVEKLSNWHCLYPTQYTSPNSPFIFDFHSIITPPPSPSDPVPGRCPLTSDVQQGTCVVVQWLGLHLLVQGVPVRSLVRELGSHISHSEIKEPPKHKKNRSNIVTNSIKTSEKKSAVCVLSHVWLSAGPWTIYSLPGSSVHGIFQGRILEWVTIFYSKGSYQPRDWTHVSCIACIGRWILYHWHQDTQHILCCPPSHLTLPVFKSGVGMWPKLSNQRISGLSFGSLGQKVSFSWTISESM